MKTRIRDSYTPKLGDYCNTFVIDKETGNQYLFDADGVWTLISTNAEGLVAEAVAQANAYTDDVVEGKVDKEEGKGLSENDFTDEDKEKLDSVEDGAQENVIEVVKRNGVALPVTDKTVDVAVPTTTSALTNDSGYITNEVDNLVNYYDKDETDTLIATEAEARDAADLNLQEQIDAISSASDVVDVVGTYAELQDYDTSKLGDNDIIKVLTDETHDDAISYYRWSDTAETFTYIGSQGPFYTKSETDATFVPQTRTINGKGLNSDVVLTAADVNALPASTVIPTVNDATLTIKKNGTTVTTFTANSAQNATADISVPTKVSDLTNDLDFVKETDLADVAFSGDYADLTGTPSIPTKTSDLTNDSNFVSDANYVHTDNNFTTTLKNKLTGIAAGAEVNVQSDWNVTDSSSDAFIKNKPSIPTKTSDLTNDSGFITSATIPTKTSDLTNDSGFITKSVSDLTNYYTQSEVNGMFNALSIPTKTSDLVNDSGFLTSIPIASATTLGGVKIGSGINVAADGTISAAVASLDWANVTNKPTNVSYWTNDAGYITSAALPTKTSDLTNDSGFITSANIPTKTSDLANDSGFITSSVSNLTNYYTKSQTYTQGEVNALLSAIVIPTVNNATLTIKRNGTSEGTFTANASADKNVDIKVDVLAITEDNVTVTTDATKGVAPYSTSYGYTNIVADYPTPTEGSVVAFIIDTKMVVASATRNVRVKFNDSDTWHPVMGASSTILAGSSYFTKAMTRLFVYKSTQQTIGALHMINDDNSTYAYLVNTIATGFHTVETGGYMARYAISFYTQPMKTGNKVSSFVTSSGTGTSKAYTSVAKYYADRGPVINYSANVAAATATANVVYTYYQGMDLRYTANLSTTYIATNDHVFTYLKNFNTDDYSFEPSKDTKQIVSATKLATAFPSSTAGDIYLYLLGTNTSTYYTLNTPEKETNFIYKYTPSTGALVPLGGANGGTSSVAWGDITGTLSSQTDLNTALGAKANSADLAAVATSGSYNDLSNKPTIPTVNNATLTIQRNSTSVGTFTANASSNKTINIAVPTATSDLTNDSGFIASITKITNAEIDAIMGVA